MVSTEDPSYWSHLTIEELVGSLGSDPENGLTREEAERRISEFGYNRPVERRRESLWRIIVRQLREPMILVLVVVGIIYALIGNPEDAVTIVVIVSVVVAIEVLSVNRARKSMESLKKLTSPSSVVTREGKSLEIRSYLLVPGDLISLSAGDRVPADTRLLSEYGLKVDESSLTGESYPVVKELDMISDSTEIADLRNMVYSGTLVVQGSAMALVTATGKNTEIGKISQMIEESDESKTPLTASLDRLTVVLAYVAVFFSVLIPLAGYFQGQDLRLMTLTGLSLAFAIIPEELPVVVSLTLAVGAYALTKKNAIVKNIHAAETLGSVTTIATDKTGTITENRMTVSRTYVPGIGIDNADSGIESILETVILATGNLISDIEAAPRHRDPMELAVYDFSLRRDIDFQKMRARYSIADQFGFDNRIRLASHLYRRKNHYTLFTSGAPEAVAGRSSSILEEGKIRKMEKSDTDSIISALDSISELGERTIAIAFRDVEETSEDRDVLEQDLVFAGMISFIDPPRKEIRKALLECQDAGIRIVMLTGDHPETASAIASQAGIENSVEVISGDQMRSLTDDQLWGYIGRTSVFARITSGDKLRIVKLLEDHGEIVAVTGDGVNDAPALESAQIGIAMGQRGTDVAKESSDMILVDDNFSTIVEAVRVGRNIYHTMRKGVKFYITVQMALVGIFLIPLALSLPFPFSPIQIIILEIFMDVGALWGFLSEKPERTIMMEPPRDPGRKFMDREMKVTIAAGASGLILAVIVLYIYFIKSSGNIIEAQTAAFTTWILAQVFLAQNLRTEREPVIRRGFFSNTPIMIWVLVVVAALFFMTVFPVLQVIAVTSSLTAFDWLIAVVAAMLSSSWMEAVKILRYRRSGTRKAVVTHGR